jgi:hypothetical protein
MMERDELVKTLSETVGEALEQVPPGELHRIPHAVRESIAKELAAGNERALHELLFLAVSDLESVAELEPAMCDSLLDFIEHRLAQHNLALVAMCQSGQGANLYRTAHSEYLRDAFTMLVKQAEAIRLELTLRATQPWSEPS